MKRAMKTALVLFLMGGMVSTLAWRIMAQRKPAFLLPPAPLTPAQIHHFFPGTTGNVTTNPDTFTLYTIESHPTEFAPDGSKTVYSPSSMNGYKIQGKAAITDRAEQARLLASAVHAGPGPAIWQAQCFEPHHALRLVKNKRTVDVIICFGCGNTQIWENGEPKTGDLPANQPAAGYVALVLTTHHVALPK